ncbi:Ig-like domain-containing protein [Cupriavidus sp. Marseille-Q8015]
MPATPVISGVTDDMGTTTGAVPAGGVTDDATPTLAGTTEAGARVDIYDGGEKIGTVTADETGAWSFTPETPLADGDHSLTVMSTDAAGNTSEASVPVAFTVDTTGRPSRQSRRWQTT